MEHKWYWIISSVIILTMISLFIAGLVESSNGGSTEGTTLTIIGGIGVALAGIFIFFLRPGHADDL